MARRPKSAYRAVSDKGREFGVVTTDDDKVRLSHLARWYALTAEHLARAELDPVLWQPVHNGHDPAHPAPPASSDPSAEFADRVTAIKRRLAKLARVSEDGGTGVGPLVSPVLGFHGHTVWHATPYGITAASLPWRVRSTINPAFAAHAGMAADIGMQIEDLGYTVYSERELSTRTTRHGDEITTPIESYYTASSGTRTAKKPDVAVTGPNGETFLAIEVERDQNRPLGTYVEKLKAYDDNLALAGVWYLCASDTTANRVAAAADRVFGDREFNLRVRVVGGGDGWEGVPNLAHDERLTSDLRRLT